MDKFAITYLAEGARHENSVVANNRDEALSQFMASYPGVNKDQVIDIAEKGRAFGSPRSSGSRASPSAARNEAPSNYESSSSYEAGRTLSQVISFIGWIVAVIGVVAIGMGLFSDAAPAMKGVLIYSGVGSLFSGLLLVVAGQVCRATVDTADNTQQILLAIERQAVR